MQFGVYSVADLTRDPMTGITPTHSQRIDGIQRIARMTEDVGLDVFAIGENHQPHFTSSSPATLLAAIAAQTQRITLSTVPAYITTNDPVGLAEEFALLQHLSHGRMDIMVGRSETCPIDHWVDQDTRSGLDITLENYHLLHRLWHEENIEWEGDFHTPLIDFTSIPRPFDNVPPFVWHQSTGSVEIADQAAFYGDGFYVNTLAGLPEENAALVAHYRHSYQRYGHGSSYQAIVGLGARAFIAQNSLDAYTAYRPYFNQEHRSTDTLEDTARRTPLAVGSPNEVIDKILSWRRSYGDVQRLLFWIDAAGLPLDTVLDQLEILGTQVVPVLREEMDARRALDTPSNPPSHDDMVRKETGLLVN